MNIDVTKTRRRIEEAIRKAPDPDRLIAIAELLGAPVAYTVDPLDVPESELLIAELVEKVADFASVAKAREIRSVLLQALPKRFMVYWLERYIHDGRWERASRDFFTDDAASVSIDRISPRMSYKVREKKINLVAMRELCTDLQFGEERSRRTGSIKSGPLVPLVQSERRVMDRLWGVLVPKYS